MITDGSRLGDAGTRHPAPLTEPEMAGIIRRAIEGRFGAAAGPLALAQLDNRLQLTSPSTGQRWELVVHELPPAGAT